MPEDVELTRCVVRKCTERTEQIEGYLPICAYHSTAFPAVDPPTLIDVFVTLMMSDCVEDLQAAIDMLGEVIGLPEFEGSYAGGWTPNDLARFGLEVPDAQDL